MKFSMGISGLFALFKDFFPPIGLFIAPTERSDSLKKFVI